MSAPAVGGVGPLQLLALGFDSGGWLSAQLLERLQWLSTSRGIRLLDALVVSRNDEGFLREEENIGLKVSSTPPGATLRSLFNDPEVDPSPTAALELRSSAEVGLDLDAVENFAARIAPGTSALLMLVEPGWAAALVDVVVPVGGFLLAFGYLEPETLLVIGPQVAEAAFVAEARDLAAAARASATLESMSSGEAPSSTMAAAIIRALLGAGLIHEADVEEVVSSLERSGAIAAPNRRSVETEGRIRPSPDHGLRSCERGVAPLPGIRPNLASGDRPFTVMGLPISDGDLSLEVRWILPGLLPPEMLEWFGPLAAGIETRLDSYLVQGTGRDTGVKLRGDSQLDVKVHEGGPNLVTMPGPAQGRRGRWRKWSFPVRDVDRQQGPAGWASVHKVRHIRFFSLAGRPILSKADATMEGGCAAELTDVTFGQTRWWTLGFEAIGPPRALTDELNMSVASMFDHPLPAGVILDIAHSTSYPEWLEANWQCGLGTNGDPGRSAEFG